MAAIKPPLNNGDIINLVFGIIGGILGLVGIAIAITTGRTYRRDGARRQVRGIFGP